MDKQQEDKVSRRKRHTIDTSDFRNDLPPEIMKEADKKYNEIKKTKKDNTSHKGKGRS